MLLTTYTQQGYSSTFPHGTWFLHYRLPELVFLPDIWQAIIKLTFFIILLPNLHTSIHEICRFTWLKNQISRHFRSWILCWNLEVFKLGFTCLHFLSLPRQPGKNPSFLQRTYTFVTPLACGLVPSIKRFCFCSLMQDCIFTWDIRIWPGLHGLAITRPINPRESSHWFKTQILYI